MALLPKTLTKIRVEQIAGPLTRAIAERHDAVLLVCNDAQIPSCWAKLPFADLMTAAHERARRRQARVFSVRLVGDERVCAVGLTKTGSSPFEQLSLARRLWKEVEGSAPRSVLLLTAGLDAASASSALEALTSAVLANTAPMPQYKNKPAPAQLTPAITALHEGAQIDLSRAVAIHEGNHLARWLTALPPNYLNATSYRDELAAMAKTEGWRAQFLSETQLRRLGAGAFLAVSQANTHRNAGIARLTYRATGRKPRRSIALVGKGICFDTGGINLKPHKSMYHMHTDMQGSAVALGTLLALTRTRAHVDVDCWLAITENEISPNAYRPQEVVTAANGTTIQVVHSDAEGRMVLADTLALAAREQPNLIIDFASLTGACIAALTERMSGVFTNRPQWRQLLEDAGRESGERVWTFPMDEDYDTDLESGIADILQCTPDSKGDHILAARFLSRFVPSDIAWIHVDTAAGHRSGGLGHIGTEITGFGVRFAMALLSSERFQVALGPISRDRSRPARKMQ